MGTSHVPSALPDSAEVPPEKLTSNTANDEHIRPAGMRHGTLGNLNLVSVSINTRGGNSGQRHAGTDRTKPTGKSTQSKETETERGEKKKTNFILLWILWQLLLYQIFYQIKNCQ